MLTDGALTARLAQGLGAALTLPAALSILTTSFKEGEDRHTALGIWGGIAGLASAIGVLLGGLLTEGPGWRWVMFVNPIAVVLVLGGILRPIPGERARPRLRNFDALGAVLATGGMLLLVYALVKAPTVGWGNARTIGALAGAVALLGGFVVNELRHRNPLAPLSIFRINGLRFSNLRRRWHVPSVPRSARNTTSGASTDTSASKSPSREAARTRRRPCAGERGSPASPRARPKSDRVGEQGFLLGVGRILERHAGHLERVLAPRAPRAEHVEADPADHRRGGVFHITATGVAWFLAAALLCTSLALGGDMRQGCALASRHGGRAR